MHTLSLYLSITSSVIPASAEGTARERELKLMKPDDAAPRSMLHIFDGDPAFFGELMAEAPPRGEVVLPVDLGLGFSVRLRDRV